MQIEGKVGYPGKISGIGNSIRQGSFGDVVVSDGMPRYYEATINGLIFTASNVAAQAVSVALATTYTGLCLSNPVGSGKNLVLLSGQYALTVAPAAIASLHLIAGGSAAGVVTHTTALAAPGIQSSLIGQGSGITNQSSVAKVDSAATIVNPYYLMPLGSGFTAAALYATTPAEIDFGGKFVIQPGGWVAWGALTAVTGFGGFTWMEVPAV
jgi:hypothetical protein